MAKRTLSELDVTGKRVLVRVDFNIPIEQGVEVIASYDQRLRATLPTIHYLLERDCRIILCSHLGRPGGKVVDALRMAPVGDRLAELLGHPVKSLADCVGPEVEADISSMEPGQVVLLENLRFHAGEEKNDPEFVGALASLADCFVMDAFAVTHRAHASTAGITSLLPSAMGLLVQRKWSKWARPWSLRPAPWGGIDGGREGQRQDPGTENILDKLDHLFIGGGMP